MATLDEILRTLEPELQKAFREAIQDISSNVQVKQVVAALERGDIQGAIDAIYLDRAAFYRFEQLISQAYGAGGAATFQNLGTLKDQFGNTFVVRFNPRNPRAEQFLAQEAGAYITNVVEQQRQLVRDHLIRGMERGDNPRKIVRDLIGTISRANGQYIGGTIGLSLKQEEAVRKALQELIDGDYTAYLERKRRDRRYDRTVTKAIREGKPLKRDQINAMIARYSDRLLRLRAETISRTEAHRALNEAQYEALRQLVDTGKVQANQIRRVWDSTGDARTRNTHLAMDGDSVGLDEDFVTPSGRPMRFPGDPRGGTSEVVNCRCYVRLRIDYFANVT